MKRWNWLILGILAIVMIAAEYIPASAFYSTRQPLQTNASGGNEPSEPVIRFGVSDSFTYNPAEVTIERGQTVLWEGSFANHPLVSDTWEWEAQWSGTEFRHTFDKPGTYHFYCQIHGAPQGVGMSGVVTVK